MKTKEEILNQYGGRIPFAPIQAISRENILQAMEEYASQSPSTDKIQEMIGRVGDFLHELQENPYPEDVFLPIPTNVLEMIHSTLMEEYKIPIDRLTGHIGRRLRAGISQKAKQLSTDLKSLLPKT